MKDEFSITKELYDGLFGGPVIDIIEIDLNQIDAFAGHTYQVNDDEEMDKLCESISINGVIVPAIVREKDNNRFELISGHRRKRACEILGFKKLPAKVVELDDDEAAIVMVDSNLHRENIRPSEKAFSYKAKMDAMRKQAGRPRKNLSQVGTNKRTDQIIAEETGESRNQVQRYIRLTYLVKELLNMVDDDRIKVNPAVELSYLSEEQQKMVYDLIDLEQVMPSLVQAKQYRIAAADGELDEEKALEILIGKRKKKEAEKEKKPNIETIVKSLPKTLPADKHEAFIIEAIRFYIRHSSSNR